MPAPLDATFAFFADAANLERLTPSWLNFEIVTPRPIAMRVGAEIEYRIRLYRVAIPWRTRIDLWEPGVRFIDRQLVGPYRWWHHEHTFHAVPDGTLVIDHVEYVPRFSTLSLAWVQSDLRKIFDYRLEQTRAIFGDGGEVKLRT